MVDRRSRALAALCVTEIVSWGVLYYAFPVMLGAIEADTGWSATATVGAFSVGALVSAGAGVVVGRLIDTRGPRVVMTTGSVLGVLGVAAIATAPTLPWFYAAWAFAGLGQAATFYPPAFAALTGWYPDADRVRALTTLTLVAGFASTVFAPLTAQLLTAFDWRATYLVLGAVLAVVTVPLHALFLTPPWSGRAGAAPGTSPSGDTSSPGDTSAVTTDAEHARGVLRSGRFVLLATVMTAAGFGMYAATINLVPLLTSRGFSVGLAALGLGLVGAGQVAGRLCFGPLVRHTAPGVRTAIILVTGGVAVVVLAVLPGPAPALIAVAILAGAGRGLHTLLQASAVADRWGTRAFGRVNGVFSAPLTLAVALAPAGGVVLAEAVGGFGPAFAILGATAVVAGVVAVRA